MSWFLTPSEAYDLAFSWCSFGRPFGSGDLLRVWIDLGGAGEGGRGVVRDGVGGSNPADGGGTRFGDLGPCWDCFLGV